MQQFTDRTELRFIPETLYDVFLDKHNIDFWYGLPPFVCPVHYEASELHKHFMERYYE